MVDLVRVHEEFGKYAGYVSRATLFDYPPTINSADAQQTAYLALYEAAKESDGDIFGEDRPRFLQYAKVRIMAAIRQEVASVGYPVSGSRNALDAESWPSNSEFYEEYTQPLDESPEAMNEEDRLSLEAIYTGLDILTDRQREVIGLYYLDGLLSDTLVADRLGITKQGAQQTRIKSEKVLREALVG